MRLCTFVCICGNSFILSEDYAKHLTTRHTCLPPTGLPTRPATCLHAHQPSH